MIRVICAAGRGSRTDQRFFCCTPDKKHSLSLYTEEDEYAFELLDIQRLL